MPRPPRPDDLARLRVPTDARLSPDGSLVAFSVQTVAPAHDGYRHAIWLAAVDGSRPPRQVTLGAKNDVHPRFSPDGRTLAFLSDRRTAVEDDPKAPKDGKDREDVVQVHLLPLDGGEARRLTDLPRGVERFEWSPDGRRLVVLTSSHGATREEDAKRRGKTDKPEPGSPPTSDYHFVDRLAYQFNGAGYVYDKIPHLWLVDVETGDATRLTNGATADADPAWSPDGTRIAYASNRRRDHDVRERSDISVVEVETGRITEITAGPESLFGGPTWLPDGDTIATIGGRLPDNAYRNDIWLFAADGSDARRDGGRNLSGARDISVAAAMNSDVTPGEPARLIPSADGRWLTFAAPAAGSYELWRIATRDGAVERLTEGRHYISSFDQVPAGRSGGARIAALLSTATRPADVHVFELAARSPSRDAGRADPRRVTDLNADVLADIDLIEPVERRWTVDGRDVQGWLIPAGPGRQPLVTEIHGGPHTFYGWSIVWEFQVLAASGMSVFFSNPRGSDGYGREFNEANRGDWGPGPSRDILAGIDSLVADGLADGARLGVTGGSYGGYLTNWILAHDDRFAAGFTARSVADMTMLFLTGDIAGGEWGEQEFGRTPWGDPDYYREISPLTYAHRITTPLLIQHSEKDLRTTIGQAEALFTVLRSNKRPARLMRVPEETHELTRSGTPFRRVENLVQVRDWFRHFLVDGKRALPPLPKLRAGK
ncbi:MAG TPA: S9 family peptidase [Candidatus Limnocylindrales bacterium]|nr:S9 family peptidase [Candidatus Limnocylindrales bacterium]